MQYFTVKNVTQNDKNASSSFASGTDSQGIEWALCKIANGTTVPAWEGAAVELTREEAAGASQSSIYTNLSAGPSYRALAIEFGISLVESFVSGVVSLTPEQSDNILLRLAVARTAAEQGYISTLRHNIAAASTIDPGFTQTAKTQILGAIDLFLAKFPEKGGTPPPQLPECLTLENGSAGSTLQAGREYTVDSDLSGPITVSMPSSSDMYYPNGWVRVQNFSAFVVTLDGGATKFEPGGATTLELQGGETALARSATDKGVTVYAHLMQ